MDHVNKISQDLDVDIDTNLQNIACPSKIMSTCNKQNLNNISSSIH